MTDPVADRTHDHSYRHLFDRREKVTIVVFEESHDVVDAETMIAVLREQMDAVPVEYRATATLEFDVDTNNDNKVLVGLYYKRLETDEEYAARMAQFDASFAKRRELLEAEERKQLARLAAKYGYELLDHADEN